MGAHFRQHATHVIDFIVPNVDSIDLSVATQDMLKEKAFTRNVKKQQYD